MIDEAFVRMMVVESVKMLNPNADMSEEFDAWLRSVKAATWDECVSHLEVPLGQEVKRLAYADNPYREADG